MAKHQRALRFPSLLQRSEELMGCRVSRRHRPLLDGYRPASTDFQLHLQILHSSMLQDLLAQVLLVLCSRRE